MRTRLLALLILVAALIIGGYSYFIFLKREEELPIAEDPPTFNEFFAAGYPAPLYSFDVTQTKAGFIIEGINKEENTLDLIVVFPYDRRDTRVVAEIGCPLSDSWVVTVPPNAGEENPPEFTKPSQPLYQIAQVGDSLQGICGDFSCSRIIKQCELLPLGD